MANFKSVAYVHQQHRSKYSIACTLLNFSLLIQSQFISTFGITRMIKLKFLHLIITYTILQRFLTSGDYMCRFLTSRDFADAVIKTDICDIPVHKVVLASKYPLLHQVSDVVK